MAKLRLFITLLMVLGFAVSCLATDSKPPRVVTTSPLNGSRDVDPDRTTISVTFNKEMRDQSWSWVYENKNTFPVITGQPYYIDNNTKNVLPVKLEPNKEYVIWINGQKFKNFKDKSGNPVVPFKFTFKTR